MKAMIWNFKQWNNYGHDELIDYESFLKKAGFVILGKEEHYFKPYGYSAIWLLAESHFAVHTFPEERKSYIELSSCVEDKFYNFVEMLKNKKYQITII